ncbi:MAG: 50S ribosomal protein L17 [Candidatus Hydrogenedentota bacterium]|nr:MAG: 50S ribosomal protein L17 [Candidatus Hydrogenedentota bacterium]GIX45617.1 MAG: 50S ribosomal protein L17 [Candidatus Sumerlaea sp.]
MRHRRHRTRLNRTTEHRAALMRNLAAALIQHEIIRTTEVKAKQLRQFIERLVTIAKDGIRANEPAGKTLAKRRLAFSYLQNKEAVKRLFDTVAPRCMERNGGYTRIVRCGRRMGDGAPMAYIEFVDRPVIIPEVDEKESKGGRKRTRKKEAAAQASA